MDEIQESLITADFPCHKTTAEGDEGEVVVPETAQHCAGALILLEKIEEPSQMMRICERIGLYDRRKLKMDAPMFDSWDEMRERMEELEGERCR